MPCPEVVFWSQLISIQRRTPPLTRPFEGGRLRIQGHHPDTTILTPKCLSLSAEILVSVWFLLTYTGDIFEIISEQVRSPLSLPTVEVPTSQTLPEAIPADQPNWQPCFFWPCTPYHHLQRGLGISHKGSPVGTPVSNQVMIFHDVLLPE
ncbi:uncharacterized protein LOC143990075 [Lithobates pipiens]